MDLKEFLYDARSAWNRKDKEEFFAHLSDNPEITMPGGVVLRGPQGAETLWSVWQGAFPDNQAPNTNVFVEGDHTYAQACGQAIFEGTHTGTLYSPDGSQIPPTGRHVSLPMVQILSIRDGKMDTARFYFCRVELLTQLGVMPALADA